MENKKLFCLFLLQGAILFCITDCPTVQFAKKKTSWEFTKKDTPVTLVDDGRDKFGHYYSCHIGWGAPKVDFVPCGPTKEEKGTIYKSTSFNEIFKSCNELKKLFVAFRISDNDILCWPTQYVSFDKDGNAILLKGESLVYNKQKIWLSPE